ncbi:hypothetical protein M1555_03545 [Patescibacteria group bacterium]|nr:hypothetical protein [Patescibacteria group bacterium]
MDDIPQHAREEAGAPDQTSSDPKTTLEYEETPIIEPIADPSPESASSPPEASAPLSLGNSSPAPSDPQPEESPLPPPVSPGKSGISPASFGKKVLTVLILVLLFAGGVWLSTVVRRSMPGSAPSEQPRQSSAAGSTASQSGAAAKMNPHSNWKSYSVVSGATRLPITGLTFLLPPDVAPPICDGANCASEGTYLPGGTRFTVAARGSGELLPAVSAGAILTDSGGRAFTMQPATVATGSAGPALEFSGLFTGTTGGGYAFAQMRGIMIPGRDGLTLEINHFTPSGVNADWTADDALFDEIVKTVSFPPAAPATALPRPLTPQPPEATASTGGASTQ